jgi:hypothetical protein
MQRVWIFDWDDTLLPSTWIDRLRKFYGEAINELISPFLETLQDCVCSMIDFVRQREYALFIITNADLGWVEYSSSKYMPRVFDKLAEYKIPIMSARSFYATMNPTTFNVDDSRLWKHEAFSHIVNQFQPIARTRSSISGLAESIYEAEACEDSITPGQLCDYIPLMDAIFELDSYNTRGKRDDAIELVVMGDSIFDINAAYSVGHYDWIHLKTIKLIESPDIQTHIQELAHIRERLNKLGTSQEFESLSVTQMTTLPGGLRFYEEQRDIIKVNYLSITFIPIQFDLLDAIQIEKCLDTILAVPSAPELDVLSAL